MNDPIDRELREITQDRCGFVEDLRQIEMSVWADDEFSSEHDDESDDDSDE